MTFPGGQEMGEMFWQQKPMCDWGGKKRTEDEHEAQVICQKTSA